VAPNMGRHLKSKKKSEKDKEAQKNKETMNEIIPEIKKLAEKARAMAPMRKEEWEKRQSVVRRIYDEETGRYRLIRDDRGMFNLGNNCRSRGLVHEGREPYASWRFVTAVWRAVAKCCSRIFRGTFCHIASDRFSLFSCFIFCTFIVTIYFFAQNMFIVIMYCGLIHHVAYHDFVSVSDTRRVVCSRFGPMIVVS